jgi:hypothetical protein
MGSILFLGHPSCLLCSGNIDIYFNRILVWLPSILLLALALIVSRLMMTVAFKPAASSILAYTPMADLDDVIEPVDAN